MVVPMISVDEPDPPAVRLTVAGDSVHVAVAGSPEQARLTLPLKVALAVIANVTTPFCPRGTVTVPGVAVSVNPGLTAVTLIGTAVEVLKLKLSSPPYTAVMLCEPVASPDVVNTAVLPLSGADPSRVVPS